MSSDEDRAPVTTDHRRAAMEILLLQLGSLVAFLVATAVAARRRARAVRRAVERAGRGETARVPVSVHGDHPYPLRPTRSLLVLSAGRAHLESLEGAPRDTDLPAGEVRVTRTRLGRPVDGLVPRFDQERWHVLVATDGSGAALRLAVGEQEVEPLRRLLASAGDLDGPATAAVRPRRRRWARHRPPGWPVLAAAVGIAQLLAAAGAVAAGDRVGPASRWALLFVGASLVLLAALPGVARRLDRVRRRGPRAPSDGSPWTAPAELDAGLRLTSTGVEDVAVVLAGRSRTESWAETVAGPRPLSREEARTARWWSVPVLRRRWADTGAHVLLAAALAALGVLGSWSAWGGWSGTQDATERVGAQVEVVGTAQLFFPDDAEARFTTAAGVVTRARVAWVGDDTGTATVEHSVTDPTRARVVGAGDGTGRAVVQSLLLWVVAVAWAVTAVARTARRNRRLRGLLGTGATSVPYLLARDDQDAFGLLLHDGERFTWALQLDGPGAGRLPLSGTADLHGALEHGARVVAVVDGAVRWPGAPLCAADDELVRHLVTGDELVGAVDRAV